MYSSTSELREYDEFLKWVQKVTLIHEEKWRDTFSVLFHSSKNRELEDLKLLELAKNEIKELQFDEKAYWMGLIFLLHKDYLYFGDNTQEKILSLLMHVKDPEVQKQCLKFTNLLNPEYIKEYNKKLGGGAVSF